MFMMSHATRLANCSSSNYEDLTNIVNKHIRTNRHFTIDELQEALPQVSRSVINDIVSVKLQYKKLEEFWGRKGMANDDELDKFSCELVKWTSL